MYNAQSRNTFSRKYFPHTFINVDSANHQRQGVDTAIMGVKAETMLWITTYLL